MGARAPFLRIGVEHRVGRSVADAAQPAPATCVCDFAAPRACGRQCSDETDQPLLQALHSTSWLRVGFSWRWVSGSLVPTALCRCSIEQDEAIPARKPRHAALQHAKEQKVSV